MGTAFLYIFISAAFFAAQFIFIKTYQARTQPGILSSIWSAILNGGWKIVIFGIACGFQCAFTVQSGLYAAGYAVSAIACSLATLHALKLGNLSTIVLYTLVGGNALPFVYSLLFTGAELTFFCAAGFASMLLSFLPSVLSAKRQDAKTSEREAAAMKNPAAPLAPANGHGKKYLFLLLCLITFFSNGLVSVFSDANAKAYSSGTGVDSSSFLVWSGLISIVLAGGIFCAALIQQKVKTGRGFLSILPVSVQNAGRRACRKRILFLMAVMGIYSVLNGLGNVFSLKAAEPPMQGAVQFPVLNAAIMIFTPIFTRLVWKEKIARSDMLGIGIAVVGLAFFLLDAIN